MDAKKSIDLLNKAVADELHAVHQYMYWHFHLDDQGFGPLAALFRRVAIAEMVHVERLAERILFLKGDVDMVPAGSVQRITDVAEIVAKAAEMEQSTGMKPRSRRFRRRSGWISVTSPTWPRVPLAAGSATITPASRPERPTPRPPCS